MLIHCLTLDVSPEATDEQIREQYLKMVRNHSPERDPEKFRRITEAYEALKDGRNRVREKIFGGLTVGEYESALLSLAKARELKRRRVGLRELLEAEKND